VHPTTHYFGYIESLNTGLNVPVHPSSVVYDNLGILYEFFNNETSLESILLLGLSAKIRKQMGQRPRNSLIPAQ
jgi:capsule polysaccharide export protein KpsC/LpsZ